MRLLLHSCCGPCTTFPLSLLRSQGFLVTGLFFNPNIWPDEERRKRWDTYAGYAREEGLSCIRKDEDHDLWLRNLGTSLKKPERCRLCYQMRLFLTAKTAREKGFDCFSTTLLVSPYQDHEGIVEAAEKASQIYGISFIYRDFRVGYRRSREMARGRHLYMQKYCGCEFSLKDSSQGGDRNARLT